jgi:hypothetical protein
MFSKVFAASTLVACAYAAVPGWHSGDGPSGSGEFECSNAMGSTIKVVAVPPTDSAGTICPNIEDIGQALGVALHHGLDNINFDEVDCVTGDFKCTGSKVYITLNVNLDKKYTKVELEALYLKMTGGIFNELKNAIDEFATLLTTPEVDAIVTQLLAALDKPSYSFKDEKPAVTTAAGSTTTVAAQVVPDAATDAKPLFATVAIAAAATLAAFAL